MTPSFPPTDALVSFLRTRDWKKFLSHVITCAIVIYILGSKLVNYIYTHRTQIKNTILYVFDRACGCVNLLIELGEYIYSLYMKEFSVNMEINMDWKKWRVSDLKDYIDTTKKKIKKDDLITLILSA